jgi:hypothetical protein
VLSLHYFCFAFACSPSLFFALFLLRIMLSRCERKETGVCVVHEKAALKPASARHQQAFLGLVLTAARLLARTKSVTQARHQHVLFGRRLLAGGAFQALYISTGIE